MTRTRTAFAAVVSLALASTVALAAIVNADLSGTWMFSVVTDNGTGTLMMMEAMRILKKFYPNPKHRPPF